MANLEMEDQIQGAEEAIGYHFNESHILWEALSAPGCTWILGTPYARDGNRRLALLGDSLIKFVLLEDWYGNGQTRDSGSTTVASVASNGNLNRIGRAHGLDAFVHNNPSQYGAVNPRTMAATVEAIVAAVYLDGGIEAAKTVMDALGLTHATELRW